jgi:Xaa-Pro aminopeptidase
VLSRIRPGATAAAIREEVRQALQPRLSGFSKPAYEQAARKLLDTGGGVFSHTVGMAVHDVGAYRDAPLKPGQVFSVDPQMWVPLDDIEKLVRETGIVQKAPALTPPLFERLGAAAGYH